MERALLAGEALADHFGVLVDQYAHLVISNFRFLISD
jgi:hypothetical protein